MHVDTRPRHHYVNRPARRAAWVVTSLMVAVAVRFLFFDGERPSDPWEVVLAVALPCAVIWTLIRTALAPYVGWDDQQLVVRNPFFTYEVPLSDVRLLGRAGRGGALEVESIGTVLPWAMTRSVFDGRRAGAARRELRHAVRQAADTATTPGRRRFRVAWSDILLAPMLGAVAWAFMP
ncbi:hypothetical protein ABZ819_05850 [Streptomyces venezuelae]|uniref:hypothetical protein n=1 Tax=Streptomyces venezuelae TaxID=54571 RepID=UPI00343A3A86